MKVLLATDGSTASKIAEALVGSIAWPAGTRIDVLRVDQFDEDEIDLSEPRFAAVEAIRRARIDEQLAAVTQQLSGACQDLRTRVVFGRPASVIVDEARELGSDLVVIGSRGHGAMASAVLGSVAAEVVDHAACPVLIARSAGVRSLVLAADGSETSRQAADFIATAPFLRGIPTRVVSVAALTLPWYAFDAGTGPAISGEFYQETLDAERVEHERILTAATERLAERGIVATAELREGDAAFGLIDAAAAFGADLIVVGSRGKTGLTRLLLGSVARGVLYHAKCSVLIVRSPIGAQPAAGPLEHTAVV